MADGIQDPITKGRIEKELRMNTDVANSSLARKVICVVDLDDDDDLKADALEIYRLSKDHGWLLVMRVEVDELGFDPQSGFYHRLFKVVKRGQISQLKFSQETIPEL